MATATQRAPSADAKIAGSGPKVRRTSMNLRARRGSGIEKLDTHTISWHTSTHKHEKQPGAEKSALEEQFNKYKELFTLTPDRLKEITKSFVGVLEEGLQKDKQTVVSSISLLFLLCSAASDLGADALLCLAHASCICLWLADWR